MSLVSVVLPVYNQPKVLLDAVKSIQNQTFQDWELIIVDDGSGEETKIVLGNIKDDKIRVIHLVGNNGLAIALNVGIIRAKGKLIARQDADDISLPRRLELQVAKFKEDPSIHILGTAAKKMIDRHSNDPEILKVEVDHRQIIKGMLDKNPLVHGTVMFYKNVVLLNGSYNETYKYAQDWELWLRLMFKGFKFGNLAEPLYRYNDGGAKVDVQNEFIKCIEHIKIKYQGRRKEWEELLK